MPSPEVRVTLGPLAPELPVVINPPPPTNVLPAGLPGLSERIPCIIHMAWLGPKPLSELNRRCIASWRKHHPAWSIWVWSDDASLTGLSEYSPARIEYGKLITGGLLQAAPNFGEASDILRLEVLRRYGGVWVDCDMECLRPIDALCEPGGVFLGAGSHPHYMQLENAVMGACAGHPLIESMVRALPLWSAIYPTADTIYRTGPVYVNYWAQVFMGAGFLLHQEGGIVEANSVRLHPQSYWYQESGVEKARASGAYGFHWWCGSWIR